MSARSIGKNGAIVLCQLAIAFLLWSPSAHSQSKNSDPHTTRVVLKILNGKTGRPIRNEYPNIWLGETASPMFDIPPRTNQEGEIHLDVPTGQSHEIHVLPNLYADCRYSRVWVAGMKLKYSVDKILGQGIVTENVCGKQWAEPVPGMLILYVRPRTFIEKWKL